MVDAAKQEAESEITLHSRVLVFENTVFHVFRDHISDRRGHEVRQYLTVAPKRNAGENVTGVAVLPVVDGRIGLVRVFRHPAGRWSWEVVKGFVESEESAQTAACRELLEESGFRVLPESLIDLGIVASEPGLVMGRIQLFSVRIADEARQAARGEIGLGSMTFLSPADLGNLIERGEVEDSTSFAILYKHQLAPACRQAGLP